MKTFKLVALQILDGSNLLDIELKDGLIINKEDEHNTWLIEAFLEKSFQEYFQQLLIKGEEVLVQVVISKPENDPAPFQTKVRTVKTTDHHISVLFEGTLRRTKSNYAELLLEDLMGKGLTGGILLQEFRDKMQYKPKLTTTDKVK